MDIEVVDTGLGCASLPFSTRLAKAKETLVKNRAERLKAEIRDKEKAVNLILGDFILQGRIIKHDTCKGGFVFEFHLQSGV
ncbi:MAG: hypothetical protein AAGF93_01780 [Cyanobacteria bacterium P01_H01_bin.105]